VRLAAGNIRNCANHAAAMEYIPELEAKLSPPVQREGMLIQSRNILASSCSTIITRRVLVSPEATNSLRSLWLTGDFNHIENRKQGLTPTEFHPNGVPLGWPRAIYAYSHHESFPSWFF